MANGATGGAPSAGPLTSGSLVAAAGPRLPVASTARRLAQIALRNEIRRCGAHCPDADPFDAQVVADVDYLLAALGWDPMTVPRLPRVPRAGAEPP